MHYNSDIFAFNCARPTLRIRGRRPRHQPSSPIRQRSTHDHVISRCNHRVTNSVSTLFFQLTDSTTADCAINSLIISRRVCITRRVPPVALAHHPLLLVPRRSALHSFLMSFTLTCGGWMQRHALGPIRLCIRLSANISCQLFYLTRLAPCHRSSLCNPFLFLLLCVLSEYNSFYPSSGVATPGAARPAPPPWRALGGAAYLRGSLALRPLPSQVPEAAG